MTHEQAIALAASQVGANAERFAHAYPDDCTAGGVYPPRPKRHGFVEGANYGWTTAFVPGAQWVAWRLTGQDALKEAALCHVDSFARRAERRLDTDTHDLGFLYMLSCVTAWQQAGDERARATALRAADLLMDRYLVPAGIVQAWGRQDDPSQRGRTIIDSLMNMPLLYWADAQGRQDRPAEAATRHATQLRDHIIRPDGSTYHTFYWNAISGQPLRGATQQGHSDDSCWARGQAWGVLGFSIVYRHTIDASFLDAARRCADYYLAHLPADGVPVWDLSFAEADGQLRDSSAGAIAACGLLELAGHLERAGQADAAGAYKRAAVATVGTLEASYTPRAVVPGGPLLLHGVYDMPRGAGVDAGSLWGDYFYLEALLRLTDPGWQLWW